MEAITIKEAHAILERSGACDPALDFLEECRDWTEFFNSRTIPDCVMDDWLMWLVFYCEPAPREIVTVIRQWSEQKKLEIIRSSRRVNNIYADFTITNEECIERFGTEKRRSEERIEILRADIKDKMINILEGRTNAEV